MTTRVGFYAMEYSNEIAFCNRLRDFYRKRTSVIIDRKLVGFVDEKTTRSHNQKCRSITHWRTSLKTVEKSRISNKINSNKANVARRPDVNDPAPRGISLVKSTRTRFVYSISQWVFTSLIKTDRRSKPTSFGVTYRLEKSDYGNAGWKVPIRVNFSSKM